MDTWSLQGADDQGTVLLGSKEPCDRPFECVGLFQRARRVQDMLEKAGTPEFKAISKRIK